jgi:hypothetical protein
LLDGTGRFFAKTGAGIGIYEAGFSCGAKKKSALNTLHLSQHKHAKPSKVISLSYIASEKLVVRRCGDYRVLSFVSRCIKIPHIRSKTAVEDCFWTASHARLIAKETRESVSEVSLCAFKSNKGSNITL